MALKLLAVKGVGKLYSHELSCTSIGHKFLYSHAYLNAMFSRLCQLIFLCVSGVVNIVVIKYQNIYKKVSIVPSSNEQLLVLSMLKSTVILFLEMAIQFLNKLDFLLMRCAVLSIGFYSVLFETAKISPIKTD
jgi:hypothetical protein